MALSARRRPSPLLALTLALVVGVPLAGAAPARSAPSGAPLPLGPAALATADAPAAVLGAPEVTYGGDVADVPAIRMLLALDTDLVIAGPRFEYLLDATGGWRTAYSGPLDGVEVVVPAPPGPHTIRYRAAGLVDGVPVVGTPTDSFPVRSVGYPTPSAPTITVDGPRITLSWDVRAALAGWPEDGSVAYTIDEASTLGVGAVGSVTVEVGYDRLVHVSFRHGPNVDVAQYVHRDVTTRSPPGSLPLTSTPNPTIVGRPVAGATLSVRTGIWRPAPVALAYQWYADGQQVPGETGSTYTVRALQDAGTRITVAVRGSAPGRASVERVSAPTPRVPSPVISPGLPAIGGPALVGRQLTVRSGYWRPAPVALSFAWLRDGVAIPGATGSTYTPTAADRGRLLSVRVTGDKPYYPDVARTSIAVRVG
ncbi:hypothetical protein ACMA46_10705 [Clavibacter sp. Sh2141]|uniref:hypothetical protein n=1 Tax=Clavibacter sp. Sh2141 TaxID=3395374 RepID=UPI0039BC2433